VPGVNGIGRIYLMERGGRTGYDLGYENRVNVCLLYPSELRGHGRATMARG